MRISGFDGLRALAVVWVFLQHFTPWGRASGLGDYGVWLFFVLSGFLITRILNRRRKAIEDGSSFAAELGLFTVGRTLRIWPVYMVTLASMLPLYALKGDVPFGPLGLVMQPTFLSNWYIAYQDQWVGAFSHLWSLAIEQQYYWVVGALVLLIPSRLTLHLCVAVVFLAIGTALVMHFAGASLIEIYVNSLINAGLIALGGLCGLLTEPGAGRSNWPGVVLAVYLVLPFVLPHNRLELTQWTPLLAAAAIVGIVQNQGSFTVLLLNLPPVRGFGAISYAFYLFHNFLRPSLISSVLRIVHLSAPGWGLVVIAFSGATVAAAASYFVLEQPVTRAGKKWSGAGASRRRLGAGPG
jgi:peptidoglycan/LPS O-acetylase OafA/YrhL